MSRHFMPDPVNFFVYKWSMSHKKRKSTFIDKEFDTVFEAFSLERD